MCNRVNPDFRRRAEVIIEQHEEKLREGLHIPGSMALIDVIEQLGQELFQQGWYAGYHDGTEHGWEDALENDEVFQRLGDGLEAVKVRVEDLVEGVDFDLKEDQGD